MTNAVFFFGAGASAPFGIPTMQGMVSEFEKTLQEGAKSEERRLYEEVCTFLNATLGRPTDLEAVFSVVESIMNWSPDRMGVARRLPGNTRRHQRRKPLAQHPVPRVRRR